MKYGTVVILGRPNTGKTTLINTLMEQKVGITSPLPQTTRRVTRVLFSDPRGKFILTDTPGVFNKISDLMGRRVAKEAGAVLPGADVVVMMVDISREKNEEENKVLGMIRKSNAKKILVFNKIDLALGSKDHLAEYLYLQDEFDTTVKLNGLAGTHKKSLLEKIFELLPEVSEGQALEAITAVGLDYNGLKIPMSSEEYIAELIREKAFLTLRKEVPYTVHVQVDSVEEKENITVIKARILTTADRYKKMIIGAGGVRIKHIGYTARKELELMSGKRIFLELKVETDSHWMERVEL